jgi:GNAT superfamily N-acetyltransferase
VALEGIRYRPATPRDAHVIAQLVAGGFATYSEFAPAGWRPRAAIQEEPEIHVRLSRGDVHGRLALSDSGRLAGFTAWMPALSQDAEREPIPGRAHLWSLFTAPDWWGSGLAAELLDWCVTGMGDSGYDTAQLWTPSDHARARRFYEREGWTADEPVVRWSPDLRLDLVLYERPLRAA